ncbi:MAG: SpoIIE family protein phosphatase [Flavobacteriales bacterium]
MLTVLLFTVWHYSFSQNKNECETKGDSLAKLADEYYFIDAKKSLMVSHDLLNQAKKCNSEHIYQLAYHSLAWAFVALSDFPEAVRYSEMALSLAEQRKDTTSLMDSYNLLGNVYLELSEKDYALQCFEKGINLAKLTNNEDYLSNFYNNIAIVYEMFDDLEGALRAYHKAKVIFENSESSRDKALIYLNLGDTYHQLKQRDSALYYINLSYLFIDKSEDQDLLYMLYMIMADDFSSRNNHAKALAYMDSCSLFMNAGRSPTDFINYYKQKAKILFNSKNYKEAYLELDSAFVLKDSILSKEIYQKLRDVQASALAERKETEIQNLKQQNEIQILKLSENKAVQRNYLLGFVFVAVLLCVMIFVVVNNRKNNLRLRYRNKIIEAQSVDINRKNNQLEQSNKEILDSINYAKRIQNAILPSQKLIKEYLSDSFILYKPKDVVAGDFYWLHTNKMDNTAYIAAADCTGHGVPGAMVSVVCNNALNRSVREYNLSIPGEILDKTREIVSQEFEKSEENVMDGMDISFVALRQSKNNENKTNSQSILWAGANNPLWIIADENRADLTGFKSLTGIGGKALYEIKPDKQPIGKSDNPTPFNTRVLNLQTGDTIYILTDGYADQFGGERGKKFKASQMKEFILSISSQPMQEQKNVLEQKFENWKGELEQVDDVCIIGFRIN